MHSDEQRKGFVVFSGHGAIDVACTPSSYTWIFRDAVVLDVQQDMWIFRDAVVLDVQQDMWKRECRYYMWHPSFDIMESGQIIPEYHVEWDDALRSVSFMRVIK